MQIQLYNIDLIRGGPFRTIDDQFWTALPNPITKHEPNVGNGIGLGVPSLIGTGDSVLSIEYFYTSSCGSTTCYLDQQASSCLLCLYVFSCQHAPERLSDSKSHVSLTFLFTSVA